MILRIFDFWTYFITFFKGKHFADKERGKLDLITILHFWLPSWKDRPFCLVASFLARREYHFQKKLSKTDLQVYSKNKKNQICPYNNNHSAGKRDRERAGDILSILWKCRQRCNTPMYTKGQKWPCWWLRFGRRRRSLTKPPIVTKFLLERAIAYTNTLLKFKLKSLFCSKVMKVPKSPKWPYFNTQMSHDHLFGGLRSGEPNVIEG